MSYKWHLNFGNLFYLIEIITCTTRSDISDCIDDLNKKYHLNYSFDKTNYSKMKSCERKIFKYFYDERDKIIPIMISKLFPTEVVKIKFMDTLLTFCNSIEDFSKDILENLQQYKEQKNLNLFLSTLFEVANFTPIQSYSLFKHKVCIDDIISSSSNSEIVDQSSSSSFSDTLIPDDYIERSDAFQKVWNSIFNSNKNITFVYGLSGNGKSSLVLDIFRNISTKSKYWFSAKLGPNDLTLDYIINDLLIAYGCNNPTTLTFTEKELELDKIFPEIDVLVFDDIEKSPEKDILINWIVTFNKKYPHTKYIITCQNSPINLFSTDYNSIEPEALNDIINSLKLSGLNETQTFSLVTKLVDKTEHLKRISNSENELLTKISNQVFIRTNGNPQAVRSSIAYIENMINCGNSLEIILNNNNILGSVRNMFTYMWEYLLDDNTKKIIATVALIYTETSAKRIADITKLSGLQSNNIIATDSELGRAFTNALGSSMIEIRVHSDGAICYTQHGLVFEFISELLASNKCRIVQEINQSITEWYLTTCNNIHICFDNPEKLKFLDDEINSIFNIMRRCYHFKEYATVIKFAKAIRYYILVRAIYTDSPNSIHNITILSAEHLNDKLSKFKELVCALNILSRKREVAKATELFTFLKTNEEHFLNNIEPKQIFRYNHAQAIYYYMNNDYTRALELWKTNEALFEQLNDEERNGEINSSLMWTAKCYKHMNDFANARKYYKIANNNAIVYGLTRSYVNSSLRLIEVDILEHNGSKDADYILDKLNNIEQQVVSFNENKYIAFWNFLYARALYIINNNNFSEEVELYANKAYRLYTAMGFLKKQNTIKQWILSIKNTQVSTL